MKHRSELGERFRAVEAHLQQVILDRFGLPPEPPSRLKEIDRALLAAEKAVLVAPGWDWPELDGVEAVGLAIEPWPPEQASQELLVRFAALEGS